MKFFFQFIERISLTKKRTATSLFKQHEKLLFNEGKKKKTRPREQKKECDDFFFLGELRLYFTFPRSLSLILFQQSTEGSEKTNRRKIISSFFPVQHIERTRERERRKKPSVTVYWPWIVLFFSLDYFRSDENEY